MHGNAEMGPLKFYYDLLNNINYVNRRLLVKIDVVIYPILEDGSINVANSINVGSGSMYMLVSLLDSYN